MDVTFRSRPNTGRRHNQQYKSTRSSSRASRTRTHTRSSSPSDYQQEQSLTDHTSRTPSPNQQGSLQLTWCHEFASHNVAKMTPRKRKQVLGEPVSFKGEFSFVNKDASNIDSKDHNAAVSWHVMNRYEKWKKVEQGRKLRKPAHSQASQSTSDVSEGTPTRDVTEVAYPPDPWQVDNVEQSMLGQHDFMANFYQSAYSSNSESPHSVSGLYLSGHTAALQEAGSLTVPDLSSMERDFPPLVARILSFAYGFVVPMTWPDDSSKNRWAYEISQTWDEIAAINNDSCYASASLCLYATLMASASNDPDLASQACFFQTQAMTELRHRVTNHSGEQNPATLKAILKLFSAETTLDNTATARIHLKMLRNLVVAEGGVILLDSWFRENLLSADCYFALKYETRPLFPAAEWTPGPLNQSWKGLLVSARVRNDHAPSVHAIIEHPNLKSIFIDLRELFRVEIYIDKDGTTPDPQLLRWYQLRKFDCISRLAEHQLSANIYPHLHLLPKLQLATCAAVALMTAMVLGCPEPVRFGQKLVKDLRSKCESAQQEALTRSSAGGESEHEPQHALLWMSYVGKLGEVAHNIPQSERWFISEYTRMSKTLDLVTNNAEIDIMKQFLFSPSLAEEIRTERSPRSSESRKGIYETCGMTWRQPDEYVPNDEAMA